MFTIESDKTINVTRGDVLYFGVSAQDKETGEKYIFQPGDVVRIAAYGKKETDNIVLKKDFLVESPTEEVEIFLGEEDTKFEEPINKAKVYWYEVVLNPDVKPQTIIGFDEDGAKIFRLYPEGVDVEEVEIEPEDIPVMDDELNVFSDRPVRNKAIAKAIVALDYAADNTGRIVKKLEGEISVERSRITNLARLYEGSTTGDAELIDGRVDYDGTIYGNIGENIRAKTKINYEIAEATKLAQPIIPFLDRLEIGFVDIAVNDTIYREYDNYVRTKRGATIHLDVGDKITCINDTRVYAGYRKDGVYLSKGWTSNFIAEESADYVLLFSNYEISKIESLNDFLSNITISRADSYTSRIEALNKNVQHLLEVENTYLSKCELAVGDATTTNAMRYSAKLGSPVQGVSVTMPDTVRFAIQGYEDKAYTKKTYDSGWISEERAIAFDNPNLHYVVIFIRIDSTKPTTEDRGNTVVMQSLSLTPILDKASAFALGNATVKYDSSNDMIRSVAHRGLSAVAPENTAPAYILAKQEGFTYVETDVQVTKDGKYVCVHDDTISKYTDGSETGAVADYTLAELQAMDFGKWKDIKWEGTKILTFEEFILLCKKLGLKPYIELKYAHSEADIAYYLNYVKKMGMSEDCVWRGAEYNATIRALSDTAVLAYDASSIMTEERVGTIVDRYSPLFFHNDASYVTDKTVELCHNHGVRIEVYTVNDEASLESLAAIGVDGITTDKLVAGKVFYENLI